MIISLIAAMDLNGVIGHQGRLPWRLPRDLKRFKRLTSGHYIIMGRRTYDSIAHPLPNRTNIIITREKKRRYPGCLIADNVNTALQLCSGQHEIFIIGGAQIYSLFLPKAHKQYLTVIHHRFPGDTTYPLFSPLNWCIESLERHPADETNSWDCSFITLRKLTSNQPGNSSPFPSAPPLPQTIQLLLTSHVGQPLTPLPPVG